MSNGINHILINMSTRKCESGASKRKQQKLQESVEKIHSLLYNF